MDIDYLFLRFILRRTLASRKSRKEQIVQKTRQDVFTLIACCSSWSLVTSNTLPPCPPVVLPKLPEPAFAYPTKPNACATCGRGGGNANEPRASESNKKTVGSKFIARNNNAWRGGTWGMLRSDSSSLHFSTNLIHVSKWVQVGSVHLALLGKAIAICLPIA